MMEVNPIDLSNEELNFELELRGVAGLGPMTHRIKCTTLEKVMQDDLKSGRVYASSSHVVDGSSEIRICHSRIKRLLPQIITGIERNNIAFLEPIVSRLNHYYNRLTLVSPPSADMREEWTGVRDTIARTKRQIFRILYPANQSTNQYSVSSVSNSTAPAHNSTAVSSGSARQINQLSLAGAVGGDSSGMERGSSASARGTSTGAIPKRTSDQSVNDLLLLSGQASAQAGNAAAEAQGGQGLPVDPRPHSLGRGRGRPVFNPNHPQRDPQPRPPNLGRDITPPPRLQNDDAEYNGLRDRVLCDLLRRERQPAEGARIPKAIHNWPFKFRGTKDSTNLNTFLDRVESFAFSEGVNNAMLLRAIKHLLQDDALDWYSRALNEGELDTWENFKLMIRQEYLSSHYGQLLREEASSRYQGANEKFQKYYRDISALFRFVQPPMSQEDKFFILKKNMNPEYATILASARPQTIQDMVEVCNAYDDTRTLLTHQRRTPIPHSSLLEPNLATPSGSQRSQANNAGWQRFGGRVNAIDSREENQDRRGRYEAASADQRESLDEDDWTDQIEQLTQQICAIRTQFQKRSNEQYRRGGNYAGQRWQSHQQQPVAEEQQPMLARNNHQQSESAQPRANQRSPEQVATRPSAEQRHGTLMCWNCDEEGHRFTDCDKAQAVFFCYRCGRKGYTLRNCPECYAEQGNGQAGSQ
ncbi:uncharacterized protein LOC120423844 [Culex pipiens pallens]|uniref:uncharacterized protein LOC120423844 n=1 Tax=Culex pipiens pallens TaxID=42434 RepID=UPI0022AA3F04|nr:uncharacterized protein LOC120423844 [Culex pipiens pallens]